MVNISIKTNTKLKLGNLLCIFFSLYFLLYCPQFYQLLAQIEYERKKEQETDNNGNTISKSGTEGLITHRFNLGKEEFA